MPTDPVIVAFAGAIGAVIAAAVTGWFTSLSGRRQLRIDMEKAQTTERANIMQMMADQFRDLRSETDSLRTRVRNTENELTDCVKKHLQAELALMRHGIDLREPPGQP